jgi:hypothetical protein
MTQPQKRALAREALGAPRGSEFFHPDGSRGPANAAITRLAEAIAEQNASDLTESTGGGEGSKLPALHSVAMLVFGAATLWAIVIFVVLSIL